METLYNQETGECIVSYNTTSEDMHELEEKVVAILGCMVALLNRGREDVLSGRSSFANSFQIADVSVENGKLPPLAIFRSEMKRCCESLQVALASYLPHFEDRSINIWRRLQRLKNVCYDAGFSRGDSYPCPMIFENWGPVYFSSKKEDTLLEDHEVAFWRRGQITDEGLNWLIQKGFKTIIDLREEVVKDDYCQHDVEHAVSNGKIEVVNLLVEVETAPSIEQVEQFASLVSNPNSNKPSTNEKQLLKVKKIKQQAKCRARKKPESSRGRGREEHLTGGGQIPKISDPNRHTTSINRGHRHQWGATKDFTCALSFLSFPLLRSNSLPL